VTAPTGPDVAAATGLARWLEKNYRPDTGTAVAQDSDQPNRITLTTPFGRRIRLTVEALGRDTP
jgi:hypothetical protein